MKGYVFLNNEAKLVYKSWEYINNDNPAFFIDNKHHLVKTWMFDTENKAKFLEMLVNFNDMKLASDTIRNFLSSIDHLKAAAPPPLPKQVIISKSNED